jgi:predicted secreted protein
MRVVGMGWFTGCVLYLLIWWTVLFAVLPIGVRPATGTDPHLGWQGAPEHPRMLRKVVITTLVAGVIWFGAWLLINSPYVSFRHGIFAAPQD